jgi:hypothetical protein
VFHDNSFSSQYKDMVFIADYARGWIKAIKFDDNGNYVSENMFDSSTNMYVGSLEPGPDVSS